MLLSIIGFSVYYVFIRPLIVNRPGLTGLAEWIAVAVVFVKLSRDFKRMMKVDESELIEVHRHRVSLKKDEWIEEFRKAQENFIEKGIKSHFIAVLTKPLYDMGWSEEKVAEMISPIVSHKDRKIPALSLSWERRIIENKNKKDRKKVVEKILRKIGEEGVRIER